MDARGKPELYFDPRTVVIIVIKISALLALSKKFRAQSPLPVDNYPRFVHDAFDNLCRFYSENLSKWCR